MDFNDMLNLAAVEDDRDEALAALAKIAAARGIDAGGAQSISEVGDIIATGVQGVAAEVFVVVDVFMAGRSIHCIRADRIGALGEAHEAPRPPGVVTRIVERWPVLPQGAPLTQPPRAGV